MRKNLFLLLSLFMATLALAQEPATFEDVQLGSNGIWAAPDRQLALSAQHYVRKKFGFF